MYALRDIKKDEEIAEKVATTVAKDSQTDASAVQALQSADDNLEEVLKIAEDVVEKKDGASVDILESKAVYKESGYSPYVEIVIRYSSYTGSDSFTANTEYKVSYPVDNSFFSSSSKVGKGT